MATSLFWYRMTSYPAGRVNCTPRTPRSSCLICLMSKLMFLLRNTGWFPEVSWIYFPASIAASSRPFCLRVKANLLDGCVYIAAFYNLKAEAYWTLMQSNLSTKFLDRLKYDRFFQTVNCWWTVSLYAWCAHEFPTPCLCSILFELHIFFPS